MRTLIYLDNSATTFPKPASVNSAVMSAANSAANPGRSGHKMSMRAAENIFSARTAAANLFSVCDEAHVVFTPNCTASLNIAVKGLLHSGDHVVVSSVEHNSVMRPVNALSSFGVSFSEAEVFPCDDDKTIESFRRSINARTKMIVCTHASNVWGMRLPVERLSALAHAYGLYFIVDAAQSAGVLPIDMREGYDAVCIAGHKGLYGPMGTGILLLGSNILPSPLFEGGTGSSSLSYDQPSELPDRLESGTPNYPGIAGLEAGISFVKQKTPARIAGHEFRLISELYDELSKIDGIRLYMPRPEPEHFVPILSFNFKSKSSEDTAAALSEAGIAVRAGLHCCPSAHKAFGDPGQGAVRISPSVFTTHNDIDRLVFALRRISRSK